MNQLSEEQNVPQRLKLWICCHCGSPRLYGSSTECKTCGALLHDTAEYMLLDSDSQAAEASPINMILFCPRCGTQHVDAPEDETSFCHRMEAWSLNAEWQDRTPQRWTNPPHKSHLCHNCFAVWRPADVPTNGVAQIKTRGKEDNTWTNAAAIPASVEFDTATAMRDKCVATLRQIATDYDNVAQPNNGAAISRQSRPIRSATSRVTNS